METTPAERVNREWGVIVRTRRRATFGTQSALAKHLKRDQSWVSRMERGQAMFTAEAMLALAAAFDVTPAALFPWPEGIERLEASRVAGHECADGAGTDPE